MSERISRGKNTPQSFRESLRFDRECPYRIRYKDFPNDDITPLHYAETIEVAVCCGITGELVVGSTHLPIQQDTVYAVPPGIVHATTIHRGPGHIYVLHISLEALSAFIGVEALVQQSGKTFEGMPCICPEFHKIQSLIQEMIKKDDMPFSRMRALLELLEVLSRQMPACKAASQERPDGSSDALHRILRWTEVHFAEPVRLEQAAAEVGFSRNYFCSWFKSGTGWTYNQYLTNLRINHACGILIQTGSISTACYDSGFQDMSYFIQIFKKTQGCTPKVYIRNSQSGQFPLRLSGAGDTV